MIEEWRDIPKSEYQISSLGRLRSKDHLTIRNNGYNLPIKGRIIKPCLDTKGYYRYRFFINGKIQTKKIHRLVADAFLEKNCEKILVNHIDANPRNNRADNLEWCTNLENVRHAIRLGLKPDQSKNNHPKSILTKRDVAHIRDEYDRLGRNKLAFKPIAKGYGISECTVRTLVFSRKHWTDGV